MHLVYPPKLCRTIVPNFSWVLQLSQAKRNRRQWLSQFFFSFFLGGGRGVNKVHYAMANVKNGELLFEMLNIAKGLNSCACA